MEGDRHPISKRTKDPIFVIGVALFASWIPARRAARIDPLEALRVE